MIGIPSGAELIYPPQWHLARGDKGTATAVLLAPSRHFLGYLNLTPRQADEQVAKWTTFRLEHNREEGDRNVKRVAGATGLRFHTGSGSCVEDMYATEVGAHYREIACLVTGSQASAVIVGATPPADWRRMAPILQRAIANVRT